VKLRYAFLFLASIALLASGCGSDSDESKSDDKPKTKAEKAQAKDRDVKEDAVKQAKTAAKKDDGDVDACRNLAMSYINLASPASSSDPKKPVELPKDRDKSLKLAVTTLEGCVKIDPKNDDVKTMLASSYMATNKYDKASPILEELAASAKGPAKPNAYYAWGLASANAKNYPDAISAWTTFVKLSPKDDPRIAQVNQSIKALKAAAKAPASAPKAASTTDKADEDKADEG
jgi:tetratricopeptide (TPR) repeat protein